MLRLKVGYDGREGSPEGALAVEGALELEVGTVPFVLCLSTQAVRLLASHRVVPAWELQQSGHLTIVEMKLFQRFLSYLLHPQVPLFCHWRPTCRTMRQAGEAVDANQVTLGGYVSVFRSCLVLLLFTLVHCLMGGVIWSRQTGHSRRVSKELVSTVPSSRFASSTRTDCILDPSPPEQ